MKGLEWDIYEDGNGEVVTCNLAYIFIVKSTQDLGPNQNTIRDTSFNPINFPIVCGIS